MTAPSLAAMLTSPGWRDVVVLGGGQEPGPTLIGSRVLMNVAGHPEPMTGELLVVLLATDHSDWRIDALISRASAAGAAALLLACLLYTSPSPRDLSTSRMPSSA